VRAAASPNALPVKRKLCFLVPVASEDSASADI
jgi:hypothetical protein